MVGVPLCLVKSWVDEGIYHLLNYLCFVWDARRVFPRVMAAIRDSVELEATYTPSQSASKEALDTTLEKENSLATQNSGSIEANAPGSTVLKNGKRFWNSLLTFGKFLGPGTIISVAYVDPDNFQTALTSGAQFEFKLLVMILLSNLIAIYLQVCFIHFKGIWRRG